MAAEYDGLRTFLADCERLGELRTITDADWDLEIGALTVACWKVASAPMRLIRSAASKVAPWQHEGHEA